MWRRKDSVQEFLFISLQPSCVAQAVFRPLVSSWWNLPLLPGVVFMRLLGGSVVEMLLCWWDGEVGWAAGSLPRSLAGFRPEAGWYSSWALTILLSLWEGVGQRAVVSGLCLLVGSTLGRKVEQSEYPLPEGDVVSCACLAALSQNMTDQGPGRQGCLGRKGFCGGCSAARRRSCSLTGSCGWVVPTAE